MKVTRFLIIALTAIATVACSNDDEQVTGSNSVTAKVYGGIDGVLTRAANTSWDNGDQIGISCSSENGGTKYSNMEYETVGGDGAFTHVGGDASGIFFQDLKEATFSAYYPFTGTEGISAGTISDVSTETQTDQKKFDFLFASGAKASRSNPAVSFTGDTAFKHKMTRLILQITTDANSGFNASDVTGGMYSLKGIKHNGTFDTATGNATATGDASEEFWDINATETDAGNVRTYSMIFYPQENANLTFKASVGGQEYTCDITPALATGTSYTYTITVKKTGLTVSGCTIDEWGTGTSGSGEATMQ